LQKEYEITVKLRCFPLHPETPKEGRSLEDLFRASPEKLAAMLDHLRRTAEELHLPFTTRSNTYNSRLAQELGLWAIDKGKGDAFHKAAFNAYFAQGLNLAEHQVLYDLVQTTGLPRDEAEKVLSERIYGPKVDQDWADARFQGITAVPTFVMGGYKLVGAQSYENITEWVKSLGAVHRKEQVPVPPHHSPL
jgi:predicted DsbA family dithiol-disulfide isomerase